MITNRIVNLKDQDSVKRSLIDISSRYNRSDLMYYGDFNILTFETYERLPFSDQKEEKSYQITPGTEFKPWLVSQISYNDPGYWWLIMEYNNIFDIEEFEAGRTIKIPSATILAGNRG